MTNLVQQMDNQRTRLLIICSITYGAWRLLTLAGESLTGDTAGPWAGGFMALAGIAGLLWAWFIWRFFQLLRAIHGDATLNTALNDERVRDTRTQASVIGLVGTILTLALMRAALIFWPDISAVLLLEILLLEVVLLPMVAFLYLDRG